MGGAGRKCCQQCSLFAGRPHNRVDAIAVPHPIGLQARKDTACSGTNVQASFDSKYMRSSLESVRGQVDRQLLELSKGQLQHTTENSAALSIPSCSTTAYGMPNAGIRHRHTTL